MAIRKLIFCLLTGGVASTAWLWCSVAGAEMPSIRVVDKINVFLITETGEPTAVLESTPSAPPKNIVFKYSLPREAQDYDAWALEISDTRRNLTYRLAYEGKLPPLLHWDGAFSPTERLESTGKYFYRLLLIRNEFEITASPWFNFSTKEVEGLGAKEFSDNSVKLGIVPNGSWYALLVQSSAGRKMLFPVLMLDTQIHTEKSHVFAYRLESSSNILGGSAGFGDPLFYTDLSLYYRYRLAGASIRTPQVEYFPPYVTPDWTQKYEVKQLPRQTNFEVGVRMMISLLDSFESNPLDDALFGEYMGANLMLHSSFPFGIFRMRLDGEVGYSIFKGRFFVAAFEMSTTLEIFPEISIGPHLRYRYVSGKRSSSDALADQDFKNHLLLGGFSIIFKI